MAMASVCFTSTICSVNGKSLKESLPMKEFISAFFFFLRVQEGFVCFTLVEMGGNSIEIYIM